ncbi:MAG: hypothetical protein PVSMB7_21630 [Chloroflexota bacterium]
MDRRMLFALGAVVAVVCIILAIVYSVGGSPLGHHVKHAILFFVIAVVAALFAAANRPTRSVV